MKRETHDNCCVELSRQEPHFAAAHVKHVNCGQKARNITKGCDLQIVKCTSIRIAEGRVAVLAAVL